MLPPSDLIYLQSVLLNRLRMLITGKLRIIETITDDSLVKMGTGAEGLLGFR